MVLLDERGADGSAQHQPQPAHEVDDAVGLGAQPVWGHIRHERDHRRAPEGHRQDGGNGAGYKQGQRVGQRNQTESERGNRRANQNEGQAPAELGAQPVRPRADRRLNEKRRDIIQGHEEPDRGGIQSEFLFQEDGNIGVVKTPQHADTKKAKTN